MYAMIRAKLVMRQYYKYHANAEKFTHGEEHLKRIPPKVFWIICIERIPLNILK